MGLKAFQDRRLWNLSKGSPLPLYQQIQELVLEHIQAGRLKPGDYLPSYPWLSRTLGVADKTVRQAYSTLQQAGIIEIQKGRGTFVSTRSGPPLTGAPAARSHELRLGVIGVLPPTLPVDHNEGTTFWPVLQAIQEANFEERRETLLLNRPGDLRAVGAAERIADRRRFDGIVILTDAHLELVERLAALKMPAVVAAVPTSGYAVDSVVFDHGGAARELTYRLIGRGHRRIGLLRPLRERNAAELEAGYRHAMGAAGLPVGPAWVAQVNEDLGETGLAAVDSLLDEKVTALLASSALLARAAAECATRRGMKAPHDLSISATVIRGGTPLVASGAVECALFDPRELGRRAVKRLGELLAGVEPLSRKEVVAVTEYTSVG